MKLYEVYILDDTDEIKFLKVSDKTIPDIEKEIYESSDYSCIMWCIVREVTEVDGYKIIIQK